MSLLVSIATSRVLPVVVVPRVMGSVEAKTVSPLTACTRAIAPATGAAGAVVKLQTTLAPIGVPAALVTVPATVAVKTVPAANGVVGVRVARSEEHTSELQSQSNLVCRLLLEKKKQ